MKKHKMGSNIFSRFKHTGRSSYMAYEDAYGFRILDDKVFIRIQEDVLAMINAGEYKILESLTEFRGMDYEEA